MPASQCVLYSQNAFDTADPLSQAQLQEMLAAAATISSSGFTCMILGQWHVHQDGTVYYNDTQLSNVMGHLPQIVAAIKASGTVQKVLITFGPFGGDFDNITNNLQKVKNCIIQLQSQAGIDGLDWDIEGGYTKSQCNTLLQLTKWAIAQGMIVTAAPYDFQYFADFWLPLLEQLNGTGGAGFAWWNLQLYGGADYGQWADGIASTIGYGQSFLVPGWKASNTDSSPSGVQKALSTLKQSYPGLSGGFMWNLKLAQQNGNTLADYANAIIAGLA